MIIITKPIHDFDPKKYNSIKKYAVEDLDIKYLPEEVVISTMTMTCKINTQFYCGNIARYVDLNPNAIQSVTHGISGDTKTNRTIITKKKKSGKKKKQKNVFYNQVSMYVFVKSKKKNPVNVKLFSNGAIQMTGCKTIDNATEAMYTIFQELQKIKCVVSKNLKMVEKPFAKHPERLDVKNVTELSIAMINSGFKLPFKIDRGKLYELLLSMKYECLYEPVKHACVNIKYEYPGKTISIFVFEKGSIIITGAKNCHQISKAFNFINKFLLMNHSKIKKNDEVTNKNIIEYLEHLEKVVP